MAGLLSPGEEACLLGDWMAGLERLDRSLDAVLNDVRTSRIGSVRECPPTGS
jgi:hypothetical protein